VPGSGKSPALVGTFALAPGERAWWVTGDKETLR
jgi:hypothetical protein